MGTVVTVAAGLVGLATGSFLDVVIVGVPAGRSLPTRRPGCPGCGAAIARRDNLPVLSWVLLRGRCRTCRALIPFRYPAVEVITPLLFVLTALRFGPSWSLPAELAFVGGLVALAAVDAERLLLPRAILYPTLALVAAGLLLAAGMTGDWRRLGVAAACGAVALGGFLALHLVRPGWMGFGDVRLAGLLGLALGWVGPWYVVAALVAGDLLGALVGVGLIVAGRAGRRTALPYGVFLGAGSVLALLVAAPVIHW